AQMIAKIEIRLQVPILVEDIYPRDDQRFRIAIIEGAASLKHAARRWRERRVGGIDKLASWPSMRRVRGLDKRAICGSMRRVRGITKLAILSASGLAAFETAASGYAAAAVGSEKLAIDRVEICLHHLGRRTALAHAAVVQPHRALAHHLDRGKIVRDEQD